MKSKISKTKKYSMGARGLSAALAISFLMATPISSSAQSDPILGQMMSVGFNFCPRGWSTTEGQLLPIASNTALFSLLGTVYGGDGRTTFGLPDLRGRTNIGVGNGPGINNVSQGQRGGSNTHTMTEPEMPSHNHAAYGNSGLANRAGPLNKLLAPTSISPPDNRFNNGAADLQMKSTMIGNTGGGQAFSTQDPFLANYWCIALQGTFPSRS